MDCTLAGASSCRRNGDLDQRDEKTDEDVAEWTVSMDQCGTLLREVPFSRNRYCR